MTQKRKAPLLLAGGLIGVMTCPLSAGAEDRVLDRLPPSDSRAGTWFTAIIAEALHHSREADAAGRRGDAQALSTHAEQALEKAKEGQRGGYNERLNDGLYALGEAIEYGRKQHAADASEHIKRAIVKLSQSAETQVPEGGPTGGRTGQAGR